MSAIAIVSSFVVSCLGILSNCSIIVLVILTKQLNSPNRILLLHLSIVCLALSVLYLWILINNSIMQSPLSRFSLGTLPESAAIVTATMSSTSSRSNQFTRIWDEDDTTTHSPLSDSIHDSMCSVNDLLIDLLQPISIWTISCINFDRYYAICSPLHYNTLFTTKKVAIFLCSGWLIIILTVLSIYLKLMITDDRHVMAVCWFRRIDIKPEDERSLDKDYYWFEVQILLTTLLTIFLPISLIVACNIRVLTIANYQRHRIASAIYESVLSAQVAITHQKNPFPPVPNLFQSPFPMAALYPPKPNPFELKRKSQKAAIVVFELIASVVILYAPYYLFVIIFSFYRKSQQYTTQTKGAGGTSETVLNIIIFLVQFLLLCSPTLNAYLYGFKNKTIQENIQNIWRKQKTKIEIHYEIQARTPSTCGSRKASLTEVTANLPHQPQLKRQLSDFFFGTSSSLTSHFNDDMTLFHSHKIHRTPSDSFFTTSNGRKDSHDFHHEYLSPNFDPLGKISNSTPSNNTTSPPSVIRTGISPSTSKTLLSNFKKLLVGSKTDVRDGYAPCENHFPQILITKHSDSLLNTQSTSRRESDIQQVALEEDFAEKEPLLSTQARSLDDLDLGLKQGNHKFQTL